MIELRFPWEGGPPREGDPPRGSDPAPGAPPPLLREVERPPKPRGRRPTATVAESAGTTSPAWLYHHLTITGPADTVAGFAEAARGPGVVPWQLDFAAIKEDIFNLVASQPPHRRTLTIEGCRILARQFRQRVEAR